VAFVLRLVQFVQFALAFFWGDGGIGGNSPDGKVWISMLSI